MIIIIIIIANITFSRDGWDPHPYTYAKNPLLRAPCTVDVTCGHQPREFQDDNLILSEAECPKKATRGLKCLLSGHAQGRGTGRGCDCL